MLDLKALLDAAKAIRPDVHQVKCEMTCGEGYAWIQFFALVDGHRLFIGETEADLLDNISKSVTEAAHA